MTEQDLVSRGSPVRELTSSSGQASSDSGQASSASGQASSANGPASSASGQASLSLGSGHVASEDVSLSAAACQAALPAAAGQQLVKIRYGMCKQTSVLIGVWK